MDSLEELLQKAAREEREDLKALSGEPRSREDRIILNRFKETIGLDTQEVPTLGATPELLDQAQPVPEADQGRALFRLVPLGGALLAAAAAALLFFNTPDSIPSSTDLPTGLPTDPAGQLPLGPALGARTDAHVGEYSFSDGGLQVDLWPELGGEELESGHLAATLETLDGNVLKHVDETYDPIWRVQLDDHDGAALRLTVELFINGDLQGTQTSTLTP